ncbi:Uncharacterized protein BP5553_03441 [Venustampulla echinocandica]|uniref:LsmAD domain-containing protein n=1 Tax=Venustampulla echinocandica TaxID=2656787 RepID=A0A370TU96_9HELO|nr:Uncharacterized protein BP5553_03441 [Venustampulla echinocandica]RDL39101.1 Uncharacterized protein BP5553_03441 [Venustampulla echinocandica]
MVQKKLNDMSNGSTKYQQSNMAFQRKDVSLARGGSVGKSEGRAQNGNASSFRTDGAISSGRTQGERPLQRWVPDSPEETDGSLESMQLKSSGAAPWDQFAEHERRWGVTTDYDENIYTTTIDKNHPQYKQRLAEAERKAREIERSAASNSHVAEERVTDNLASDDNGPDEEDKYSGVRRQDFPPLSASTNKYTPPARRAPTGQATVTGAPVDPAIITSQLARPEKPAAEKKASPAQKASKSELATPPTTTGSSAAATPEPKPAVPKSTSTSRNASPQIKSEAAPNATATVERDVTTAFKSFANQQRRNVELSRANKLKNDKEIKLNDLKKFADSFKLNTPVPSDLVSIIAKDPAKQKEIQEKAKRNAEESKTNPSEAAKPITPASDARPAQRPVPATHGASPANVPSRQNPSRGPGAAHQGQHTSQSFRDRSSQGQQQQVPVQQNRTPGNLGARLRNMEQQKQAQVPLNLAPTHETRLPPTGPSNAMDPNFSRRSSGVASAQGGRLNPNSSEFRPSPHAATFNPNSHTSTGSSPRSAATTVEHTPVPRSLLKRKPIASAERPSLKSKLNALEHIMTIKPGPEKNWKYTGGLKPAYDTPPLWRQVADDEKSDSTMHLTYTKLFEMTPFPTQTMSPPNPSHAAPQVPHQHQLPFHLQQGVHNMGPRQSPRQPPMNLPGNQHGHGPTPPFGGPEDHRMMPSQSAQSFASPRLHNVSMAFPSPMNQPAQLAYNGQMMPYPGAPPMQPFRSLSQSHQFGPQQPHMAPAIMMQNPAGGFMTSQGMAPGPQMMYPQGGQGHFMAQGNGHPPAMPGVNGYPSPGRSAPMMMSQGSQQGHQQPPMFNMNPGMSPGPQYGNAAPIYPQQPPLQMSGRNAYNGPGYATSPQQMHQFGPQHRNNHPNGNYNNKNFQQHGQHPNGPPNNQIPNGPQARVSEGGDETK